MLNTADILKPTPDWNDLVTYIEGQEEAKIYQHPQDERLVVRRLEMSRLLGETGLAAPTMLATSKLHFKKIQELGMAIPPSAHRLDMRLKHRPVLYSVVERILEVDTPPEASVTPVNPILQQYYSWAQTTHEPYYLKTSSIPPLLGASNANKERTFCDICSYKRA